MRVVGIAVSAAGTPSAERAATELGARLYETYAGELLRFCRRQLSSAEEAEDALQTTFADAVQALRRGVVPECESAWLYTIAKHVCSSERRATGRRTSHVADVELETIAAPERADDPTGDIRQALASLPERQRRALLLREWLGLSSSEVAGRLGMRPTETYAVLTRARRSMAEALTLATGRTSAAINLGSLVLKLRALLFGGTAKTAATGLAVVVAAVGGVAVERSVDRAPHVGPGPRAATAIVSPPDARDRRREGDAPPREATRASITATDTAPSVPGPSRAAASGLPSVGPVSPPDAQPGPSADTGGPTMVSSEPAAPLPTSPVVDLGAVRDRVPVPDLVDGVNGLLPPFEAPVLPEGTDVTKPVEDPVQIPAGLPEPPGVPDPPLLP